MTKGLGNSLRTLWKLGFERSQVPTRSIGCESQYGEYFSGLYNYVNIILIYLLYQDIIHST